MGMAHPDIAAWYLTESPVVRRYLLALTGSPDLAEDLTQETFVQAMLALPGYRGGNVQAYLRGIARRVYAGEMRRQQRRRSVEAGSGAPAAGLVLDPFPLGERLLPELSHDDRYLLIARGAWQRPFREIAELLGRSENWARVRYFRLITRCRADLRKDGEERART